ncbi:uncharacterized protein NFIA_060510 [Aspergillus fischeri NRRL 181]|uniref:Uncharacterized protein n=1 Tax=Neosartorya fischeri (strain ATCC 1020 / DSM 3700 / CBS 544.65 / FGSC A1164 / JCM 1740 / NRRL 181 / WB 181) TaxID=331117 RepID=A1DPH4_NEOFI|nr:uncharacterized protein NFIA_060510 [Aspergillus fischeri NRRL 181]EAW16695.1 hypothetical protein NFIA_060510 [Aspergillus fischeri NRRL 181]
MDDAGVPATNSRISSYEWIRDSAWLRFSLSDGNYPDGPEGSHGQDGQVVPGQDGKRLPVYNTGTQAIPTYKDTIAATIDQRKKPWDECRQLDSQIPGVHIDDAVEGHLKALDPAIPDGSKYLLTGKGGTWKEVVDVVQ